jgi:hypothetical protein
MYSSNCIHLAQYLNYEIVENGGMMADIPGTEFGDEIYGTAVVNKRNPW